MTAIPSFLSHRTVSDTDRDSTNKSGLWPCPAIMQTLLLWFCGGSRQSGGEAEYDNKTMERGLLRSKHR